MNARIKLMGCGTSNKFKNHWVKKYRELHSSESNAASAISSTVLSLMMRLLCRSAMSFKSALFITGTSA